MGEKKKCLNGCNYPRFSKGLCKLCWQKQYAKPIKKVSESHRKTLDEYSPKRKLFLSTRPLCEMKLEGCTRKAVCIHHKKAKHSKALYLDETYWMPACISCNNRVETLGEEAYRLGLKIRHNTK